MIFNKKNKHESCPSTATINKEPSNLPSSKSQINTCPYHHNEKSITNRITVCQDPRFSLQSHLPSISQPVNEDQIFITSYICTAHVLHVYLQLHCPLGHAHELPQEQEHPGAGRMSIRFLEAGLRQAGNKMLTRENESGVTDPFFFPSLFFKGRIDERVRFAWVGR